MSHAFSDAAVGRAAMSQCCSAWCVSVNSHFLLVRAAQFRIPSKSIDKRPMKTFTLYRCLQGFAIIWRALDVLSKNLSQHIRYTCFAEKGERVRQCLQLENVQNTSGVVESFCCALRLSLFRSLFLH
jgi:hypothetical protein